MNQPSLNQDTPAWIFFAWTSFVVSVFLMCIGIYNIPTELWVKGYLVMGLFFSLGSSFTLAKALRDNHEAKKIINKLSEAKTEKILHDLEYKNVA